MLHDPHALKPHLFRWLPQEWLFSLRDSLLLTDLRKCPGRSVLLCMAAHNPVQTCTEWIMYSFFCFFLLLRFLPTYSPIHPDLYLSKTNFTHPNDGSLDKSMLLDQHLIVAYTILSYPQVLPKLYKFRFYCLWTHLLSDMHTGINKTWVYFFKCDQL